MNANMLRKTMTIHVDLHMEILKFLPSKSLMRFRCVSKTWNCNILDPIFAKLHRTISQTRPGATATILMENSPRWRLYFCKINHQREAIHELTIDSKFQPAISITQVVNGLVCFCMLQKGEVFVCNITTHEIISLPTQPDINHSDPVNFLGYDPLNDEYKVLCIRSSGLKSCKCMVFTIRKDNEWRDVSGPLDLNLQPTSSVIGAHDGLYHDGAIYCLSQIVYEEKRKLVAFDVREEKFQTFGVPDVPVLHPVFQLSRTLLKLVQIGGRIAVCACLDGSDLFLLEDLQKQVWVQRNIQVPTFFCHIGSTENKLIFLDSAQKMFAFDPNDGEVSQFVISGLDQVIKEPKRDIVFPGRSSISEMVENIYPLRRS